MQITTSPFRRGSRHVFRTAHVRSAAAELRSLATIAIALLACEHPETGRVSANVIVIANAVRITWCSFCGAISSDEGPGDVWQRSVFALLFSTAHLRELSLVLHAIARWHAALRPAPDAPPGASPLSAAVAQDLRATLPELTCTALYRDLERLDRALAARVSPRAPVVP